MKLGRAETVAVRWPFKNDLLFVKNNQNRRENNHIKTLPCGHKHGTNTAASFSARLHKRGRRCFACTSLRTMAPVDVAPVRVAAADWMKGKLSPDIVEELRDAYARAQAQSPCDAPPQPSITPPECLIELGYCPACPIAIKTHCKYHEIVHRQVHTHRSDSLKIRRINPALHRVCQHCFL